MAGLKDASAMAALPAVDLEQARWFYGEMLGLDLCRESVERGELVYELGDGSHFVIYHRSTPTQADHTELAFVVDNVEATVEDLRGKGIVFEEYELPGVEAVHGIVQLNGEKAAWFRDPEGNLLAIAQSADTLRTSVQVCDAAA